MCHRIIIEDVSHILGLPTSLRRTQGPLSLLPFTVLRSWETFGSCWCSTSDTLSGKGVMYSIAAHLSFLEIVLRSTEKRGLVVSLRLRIWRKASQHTELPGTSRHIIVSCSKPKMATRCIPTVACCLDSLFIPYVGDRWYNIRSSFGYALILLDDFEDQYFSCPSMSFALPVLSSSQRDHSDCVAQATEQQRRLDPHERMELSRTAAMGSIGSR